MKHQRKSEIYWRIKIPLTILQRIIHCNFYLFQWSPTPRIFFFFLKNKKKNDERRSTIEPCNNGKYSNDESYKKLEIKTGVLDFYLLKCQFPLKRDLDEASVHSWNVNQWCQLPQQPLHFSTWNGVHNIVLIREASKNLSSFNPTTLAWYEALAVPSNTIAFAIAPN